MVIVEIGLSLYPILQNQTMNPGWTTIQGSLDAL